MKHCSDILLPMFFLLAMGLARGQGGSEFCDVLPDRDGDGHAAIVCGGNDCDDFDRDRYPNNIEVCDDEDHDEDCDPGTVGGRDVDDDGFIDSNCCNTTERHRFCGDDCNDRDPGINRVSQEVCNRKDDDCDGHIDEGASIRGYTDTDGDGFGLLTSPLFACAGTPGHASIAGDCDDLNPNIIPGGSIVCADPGGQDPASILICGLDLYKESFCPAGTVCQPQPGGNGICVPQ